MTGSPAKFLRIALTAAALSGLVFFIIKFRNEFLALREITPAQTAQMAGLVLLAVALNGAKLKRITQTHGIHLSVGEGLGLSSLTTTLNHFFFKAGALVTSNYLKRQHGFSYMAYAGSLGADQLVLLFAAAVLGFGVASGLSPGHPELRILAGLYFLGAAVLFAFMRGIFSPQSREHSFWDPLIRAVQALAAILQNRNLFWTLLAYNLGLIGSTALRFFVACTILKLDVPLTYCFLITTIILLVSVVPLFQSDVGARELAVGLFAQSVGLGFDEGLLATVVDRGFVLLVTGLVAAGFRNLLVSTRGPSSPPP